MKKVIVDKAKRNLSTFPAAAKEPKRLGFMRGEIEVPDDFDRMGEKRIAALFEDEPAICHASAQVVGRKPS
jgi:hypothetical protein